jgi:hypothetical protein
MYQFTFNDRDLVYNEFTQMKDEFKVLTLVPGLNQLQHTLIEAPICN